MHARVQIGRLTEGYVMATAGDVFVERVCGQDEKNRIQAFCEKYGRPYRNAQADTYYMKPAYIQLVVKLLQQGPIPYTVDSLTQLIDVQSNSESCDELAEHFCLNWRDVPGVMNRQHAEMLLATIQTKLDELLQAESTLKLDLRVERMRRADGTFMEVHAD